jgi:hypothetical protein
MVEAAAADAAEACEARMGRLEWLLSEVGGVKMEVAEFTLSVSVQWAFHVRAIGFGGGLLMDGISCLLISSASGLDAPSGGRPGSAGGAQEGAGSFFVRQGEFT